jgi:DNA adenine methylase
MMLFNFGIQSEPKIVNVSSVPKYSPFRYPGGKTWLVPVIREWLLKFDRPPRRFVEPFAGGAIISLTMGIENKADQVIFCELDHRVATVWKVIFSYPHELCERILTFNLNLVNVNELLQSHPQNEVDLAFQTIVRNRVQHGGIIAPGASLMKEGENGKGLRSRWYPSTLARRIMLIYSRKSKFAFLEGDGFDLLEEYKCDPLAFFFVDPPYTVGGKKAGRRLYNHNEIDHELLFKKMSEVKGPCLMTYDNAPEVNYLAEKYKFDIQKIPMKNTHHEIIYELVITNR